MSESFILHVLCSQHLWESVSHGSRTSRVHLSCLFWVSCASHGCGERWFVTEREQLVNTAGKHVFSLSALLWHLTETKDIRAACGVCFFLDFLSFFPSLTPLREDADWWWQSFTFDLELTQGRQLNMRGQEVAWLERPRLPLKRQNNRKECGFITAPKWNDTFPLCSVFFYFTWRYCITLNLALFKVVP